MTTDLIQTTIRLGGIELDVHQLEDGSYSAPGLFRLKYTYIYRYGECWYWLGDGSLPDMRNGILRPHGRGEFLAFQGNKLCYLYVNPLTPEREALYVPIPSDLTSVIEFCVLGKLSSDKNIRKLVEALDRCFYGTEFSRPVRSLVLLKDTATYLPDVKPKKPDVKAVPKATAKKKKKKKAPSTNNNRRNEHLTIIQGDIYLVRLDAHLKLGFTLSLTTRLKYFKTTSARVELIKSVKGTIETERRLHATLGSKVRELYDFEDEQRIIEAMDLGSLRRRPKN